MTCPTHQQLRQFLAEDLADVEREFVEFHVAACDVCQSTLDQLTNDSLADAALPGLSDGSDADHAPSLVTLMNRLQHRPLTAWSRPEADDEEFSLTRPLRFPASPTPDAPMGRLDAYDILEELGRGATGYVFKARDPRLNRLVAIKVLKPELSAIDSARARFEREARAVAALKHECVVAIHEVASPTGFLPYLVMEYVAGGSLADRMGHFDKADPREVVRTVKEIAEALVVAHERGIVHRDIKPSNILLDASTGRVKIADFGLARNVEIESGLTVDGVIAGTPSYMSPEQITDPQNVDGRSDGYSMGIILYELLTGETPFRGVTRMVLMQVLHEEPAPPRRLNDHIPRDLETICLKAIAKEPNRRYQSARELADDLQRWLDGRPVLARPIGTSGRLWRWAKRNPNLASLSALIVCLLITGAVGWSILTHSLWEARDRANRAAQAATEQRDIVVSAIGKMVHEAQDTLAGEPRMQALRQSLLEIALDSLRQVTQTGDGSTLDTGVRAAAAHNRLGDIARELGRDDEAVAEFKTALAISRALLTENPDSIDVKQALAFALWSLGDVYLMSDATADAEACHIEALSLGEDVAAADPTNRRARQNLALGYDRLGDLRRREKKYHEALALFNKSLAVLRELRDEDPASPRLSRNLAATYQRLGSVSQELGQESQAEDNFRLAHGLFEHLASQYPDDSSIQSDLALSYSAAAQLAERRNNQTDARDLYLRSHAILLQLVRRDPENAQIKSDLASVCADLGTIELERQRMEDARAAFEAGVTMAEDLARHDATPSEHRAILLRCQKGLAAIDQITGHPDRAKLRMDSVESHKHP